jgi:hypothetical protein
MPKSGKKKPGDLSGHEYWSAVSELKLVPLERLPLRPDEGFTTDAAKLCEIALKMRAQSGAARSGPVTEEELKAALASMRTSAAVARDVEKEAEWKRRGADFLARHRHLLKKKEITEGRIKYSRACMIYMGMTHHPDRAVEKVRAVLTRYWRRAATECLTPETLDRLSETTDGSLGEFALLEEIEGFLGLESFAMVGQLLELGGDLPTARKNPETITRAKRQPLPQKKTQKKRQPLPRKTKEVR